jgi:hypothetical protein
MNSSKTTGEVRPNGEQFVEIARGNSGCYYSSAVVRVFGAFRHASALSKAPTSKKLPLEGGSHLANPGIDVASDYPGKSGGL